MKNIKPIIKNTDPLPDSTEEEILFPVEDESNLGTFGKKKKSFSLIKFLFGILLLITVFYIGYSTQPDKMQGTVEILKSFTSQALEKIEPGKEFVDTKIIELLDKNVPGKSPSSAASPDGTQVGRKIKYWQAPMNPAYTSDKPGKSPMGMDLIPVYEDEFSGGSGIRISPAMTQNIGVKTTVVKTRTLTREIRTVGILAYDERKVTHIHTKYQGWIEKLYVDFTGQEVNENDLLVEIYSPELLSTQEELLLAMKYQETLQDSPFTEIGKGATRLLDSTRRRLELFDVPEHQIEDLMRDKKITKTLHIHSPFRGFVIKKDAHQGMFIKPGMSLYTIADLSNIWVIADVYEYELPWIKVGQEVVMNLSYYPGKRFKGKVTFIDPFLNPKTRTLKVRLEFNNPNWDLKPDMYANVTFKSIISKKAIAVPEEAVIRSGEKEIVIVMTPQGEYDSREITIGAQANGYYQVPKGLKAGEKVITSSNFFFDSESRLREAMNTLKNTPTEKIPSMKSKKSSASTNTTTMDPLMKMPASSGSRANSHSHK